MAKTLVPASTVVLPTSQPVSVALTAIGPPAASSVPESPDPQAATEQAVTTASRRGVLRTVYLLGLRGGGSHGRRLAGGRLQEQEEDGYGVDDPGDDLEHRGRRGDVEHAGEQRGVPRVGVEGAADVVGQVVEPGHDGGLLQVVHAVLEDSGGDQD